MNKALMVLFAVCCFGFGANTYAASFEKTIGEELFLEDKGISLTPPNGWSYSKEYPGLSLLLQKPKEKKESFQSSVQVMTFSGAKFIDEVTAREYQEELKNKFSGASRAVKDFNIRNFEMIQLTDERNGILFFSDFSLLDKKMMQAHLLISNKDYHYLISFTDYAAHFEQDHSKYSFDTAWEVFSSVKISGKTPGRYDTFIYSGVVLLLLVVMIVGFKIIQIRKENASLGTDSIAHIDDDDDTFEVDFDPEEESFSSKNSSDQWKV